MTGRRKSNLGVGMSRLYVYKGKRTTTYYTITPDNKRINLGHDLNAAKRELLNLSGNPSQPDTVSDCLDDLIKLREKQVMEGKRSAATLASNLLEVENLKKAFGKMYPRDIKPTHIWHYLHKYRGKECVFQPSWTVIPREAGHAFRGKLDSRCVVTRGVRVLHG